MNIVTRTAMILAVAAGTFSAATVPASASAAAPRPASASASASLADGYVYAWVDANKRGYSCAWVYNDRDWSNCTARNSTVVRNMRRKASSLLNNGYAATNDKVNFYYGLNYTGSWACLGRGDQWLNLASPPRTFTWGTAGPGYREPINDKISSHKWVSYCGH